MIESPEVASPRTERALHEIELAVQSAVSGMSREEALDTLDLARAMMVRLLNDVHAQRRS